MSARSAPARSGVAQSIWSSKAEPASRSAIGPCRMTLPRSTMATASQVRSTSSSRWDDRTTVRPSATRDWIISRISSMPAGSSPFIGSSRMSSCGSPRRQAATPRRWRMPIEYLDTLSSARCGDAHPLERGIDAGAGRRLPGGCQDLEVLPTGEMAVEPGLVDDGTDPGQRPVPVVGHRVAEEGHRPGVGVGQSEQHPDEGRLARTVRSEVAEGTAPGDEELDPVDGDVVLEPFRQPVGLDGPGALVGPLVGFCGECGSHPVGTLWPAWCPDADRQPCVPQLETLVGTVDPARHVSGPVHGRTSDHDKDGATRPWGIPPNCP